MKTIILCTNTYWKLADSKLQGATMQVTEDNI